MYKKESFLMMISRRNFLAEAGSEAASKITKVALTCDTGTIDDESFNQACWSAVSSYMGG